MGERACILCPVYRPDADPRTPERAPVCEGDRHRIGRDLADIANLHHRLVNPDPVEYDDRWYDAQYEIWDDTTKTWVAHSEQRRNDPLGAIRGVAAIPGRSKQPSVSGSRERAVPVNVDAIDLAAPARQTNATDASRVHPEDRIGHLSVASVLDSWVRDWRDTLWAGQHLPPATVDELVAWLRAGADADHIGARIDDACDRHPAIDEFAREISQLRRTLRGLLGEIDPPAETIDGVTCQSCDFVNVLIRRPGDTYRAECGACGLLYTEEEFRDWVKRSADFERATRTPEEIQRLLSGGTRLAASAS